MAEQELTPESEESILDGFRSLLDEMVVEVDARGRRQGFESIIGEQVSLGFNVQITFRDGRAAFVPNTGRRPYWTDTMPAATDLTDDELRRYLPSWPVQPLGL